METRSVEGIVERRIIRRRRLSGRWQQHGRWTAVIDHWRRWSPERWRVLSDTCVVWWSTCATHSSVSATRCAYVTRRRRYDRWRRQHQIHAKYIFCFFKIISRNIIRMKIYITDLLLLAVVYCGKKPDRPPLLLASVTDPNVDGWWWRRWWWWDPPLKWLILLIGCCCCCCCWCW